MLKIICIYYLIGLLITLIITGKDLTEDIRDRYELIGTIVGMLILALEAPVLLIYGFFKSIYILIKEES